MKQSRQWCHHIAALQTTPGGKKLCLTPGPHPCLKKLTQMRVCMWLNDKESVHSILNNVISSRRELSIIISIIWRKEVKWPLNAVHCWSAVFFHYWFYFYVEIKPLFSFLFFFAVTVYQACRHTSKLTWTDCEDGLIKDCCVCLSFFFLFIPSLLSSPEKRAFPPPALCSSQFPHKTRKEPSKSVIYFLFKWWIGSFGGFLSSMQSYSNCLQFGVFLFYLSCRRVAKQVAILQSHVCPVL